jgi:hypothetical protein
MGKPDKRPYSLPVVSLPFASLFCIFFSSGDWLCPALEIFAFQFRNDIKGIVH